MRLTKKQLELVQATKNKLIESQEDLDLENAHMKADQALCELLKGLGFEDLVYEFESINKWYT